LFVVVAVGGARNVRLQPFKCEHPFLRMYRFFEGKFILLHTTFTQFTPSSLLAFRGWLAVGERN